MGPELSSIEETETDSVCADCEEDVAYTNEIFLVQVVQPIVIGGSTFLPPVLDEHDPQGDFLFEPYVYCFDCWEEHYNSLKKEAEDVPPVQDTLSVLECTCCGSGIREGEYAGTFTLGELRPSNRLPSGVPGAHFLPNTRPEILCLYCLYIFNDNYIVMWEELSQFGECGECLLSRCWRHKKCGCRCHETTTENATP